MASNINNLADKYKLKVKKTLGSCDECCIDVCTVNNKSSRTISFNVFHLTYLAH